MTNTTCYRDYIGDAEYKLKEMHSLNNIKKVPF